MTLTMFLVMVGIIAAKLIGLARYFYLLKRDNINPAVSTWIILSLATGLSLITYGIAEHVNLRAGILNTVDVLSNLSVLVALYVWKKSRARFEAFEKWYLAAIGLVILYGLVSGNAWGSNLFIQVLLIIAYIPTLHKLFVYKRNIDSYAPWGMGVIGGLLALYPALAEGNILAVIYVVRSIVSCTVVICLMGYYDWRSWREKHRGIENVQPQPHSLVIGYNVRNRL